MVVMLNEIIDGPSSIFTSRLVKYVLNFVLAMSESDDFNSSSKTIASTPIKKHKRASKAAGSMPTNADVIERLQNPSGNVVRDKKREVVVRFCSMINDKDGEKLGNFLIVSHSEA